MFVSGRNLRRFTAIAVLAAMPLVAACGDDDDSTPRPTATATQAATATATTPPTATVAPATATATSVPPTQTAIPATSTATAPPTATSTPESTATATATATVDPNFRDLTGAAEATFAAHGSVNQVYVTGATEGEVLELVGPDSVVQQTGTVDSQGALVFRNVDAGAGFRVITGYPDAVSASPALAATDIDEPPAQEFYDSQVITGGYGYLQTRDGTLLSINVLLPGPINGGPYPTVIEYSGYDPSNPDAPQPSSLVTSLLGYAVVGINIRGTGCSGGAFQFFEPLQWTDGYDAIEVIAAQPWVKDHQVGMVGLSYPGISQLFVSRLNPPSLEAVAPLSTISDVGRGTLYPGGILNNGFATDWAADRKHDAQPFGQSWTHKRRDNGDQVCIKNQELRLQSPDILDMIADNQFYIPEVADPVTPLLFVKDITVPVFLAHAWQDEQVGGYAPNMIPHFTGTEKKHFTLVNGGHSEPLTPAIFHRWIEFLSFYVRKEVPATPAITGAILGFLGSDIFGATGLTLPPDRFSGMSYEQALAEFESEKPVRVLFESGAGFPGQPGAPVPGFEASFDTWPIPGTVATAWYFADGGALSETPVTTEGIDTFHYDATHSQRGNLAPGHGGNDVWLANAPWNWQPLDDGRAVAYATAPLAADTVMIGTGSADLMVRADQPDVDLQVTLTEIRPDGKETYIQNGWLRASRRVLDEEQSTELRPVATHLEADAAPLPAGQFSLVRVEIFPFAHVFRAGSRIRLSVQAPGNDRAIWKFDALATEATVEIALDGSRVVLPVIPGIEVPTELPPCEALRCQPCRDYEEIDNSVD